MAVVTFSTVGFGDFVPRSELGRLLACVWMVLGVLAFVRRDVRIGLPVPFLTPFLGWEGSPKQNTEKKGTFISNLSTAGTS